MELSDEAFLLELYASTRVDELAQVPWTDEQKSVFVTMQFRAQAAHYAQHYPGSQWAIVLADETPVGRLYVWRSEREIRIMDLTVLPAFRGRGIGTTLLSSLGTESDTNGVPLTIHVERNNPARRLYERLGFEEAQDKGVYLFLRRTPRNSSAEVRMNALESPHDGLERGEQAAARNRANVGCGPSTGGPIAERLEENGNANASTLEGAE